MEIVPQGDRILIRTNQDRAPSNQRVADDLEVTVPRGVTVEARGISGDYDVSEIAGDVELASDRGDARLGRIGGNARVQMGRSDLVRAVDVKGSLSNTCSMTRFVFLRLTRLTWHTHRSRKRA